MILLLPLNGFSSSFFVPDSDTAALIALVSNTASTVTNTMKILEVAEKTSEQMDKYNFIAMRRYYTARRIEQHVRDMAEIQKMKPKNLEELNRAMLMLKVNLQGLKSSIDFLAKDIWEADDFSKRYWEKILNSLGDEKEMKSQEIASASEGAVSKHVQNTAINTALTASTVNKMRRDNLEYQKIDIDLKKSEALEKLRREEHYKQWLEVDYRSDKTRFKGIQEEWKM